jgi:hypothetical protein
LLILNAMHPNYLQMNRCTIVILLLLSYQISAQEYDAELIQDYTNVLVEKGTVVREVQKKIKINSRNGEIYCKVSLPFSPLLKLSSIKANISDKNGIVVRKLKKSEISIKHSISDLSFYEDDMLKFFTLKHNSYPYYVNYSYKLEYKNYIDFIDWDPILSYSLPTLDAKLTLQVSSNECIRIRTRKVDPPQIVEAEGLVNYTWNTSYDDIIKGEYFSSPPGESVPSIRITPEKFHFEIDGTTTGWVDYGNWQHEINEGLSDLPLSEIISINEAVADVESIREKVKILYNKLQDETRYINISIETGGLKPYPASYVAEKKYGDCKALSNYFKSVLSEIGVESFYAKVYAGSRVHSVDTNFVAPQFNHIVLMVPVAQDTLWLDCTSDNPFSYIGTFIQNRLAFIIDKDNSHFVKIPQMKVEDVLQSKKLAISRGAENTSTTDFIVMNRGKSYEQLMSLFLNVNKSTCQNILRSSFVDYGFDPIDISLITPLRDSKSIELKYNASSTQVIRKFGSEHVLTIPQFQFPLFEDPESRKRTVQIDYPIFEMDTIIFKLNNSEKIASKTGDFELKSKFGSYSSKSEIIENNLLIYKSLLLFPGVVKMEEYPAFYEFANKIHRADSNIRFTYTRKKNL